MTDNFGAELGNTQALTAMLEGMRKGKLDVAHNGIPVHIGKKLGGGGSKNVFDAVVAERAVALAVPNTVDHAERVVEKWKLVLNEPANTDQVRVKGFYTNPLCEVLPVQINGVPFPALQMMRFSDHPYPILDGKNVESTTAQGTILPEDSNQATFEAYMGSVLPDIKSLIKNGIWLEKDSVNICLIDGKPRLYLTDLGLMHVAPFNGEDVAHAKDLYARMVVHAFQKGLPEAEKRRHDSFLYGEPFAYDNPTNVSNNLAKQL